MGHPPYTGFHPSTAYAASYLPLHGSGEEETHLYRVTLIYPTQVLQRQGR